MRTPHHVDALGLWRLMAAFKASASAPRMTSPTGLPLTWNVKVG